jgi:hypothetical protein
MFSGVEPVSSWFTPIAWTGYILVLDGFISRYSGVSWIRDRTSRFLFMLVYSIAVWFLFEAYNLHLRNWHYVNLPDSLTLRIFGYFWSFATVLPGILLTSELVDLSGVFESVRVRALRIPRAALKTLMVVGFLFCVVPLLVPKETAKFLFIFVWLGFVFLLDPINYLAGGRSLVGQLAQGRIDKLLSLFASGVVCGLLWEFWNYWAQTKWVYDVPYLSEPRIFEMPLYGFLGFLPFAVECYVFWELAMVLGRKRQVIAGEPVATIPETGVRRRRERAS